METSLFFPYKVLLLAFFWYQLQSCEIILLLGASKIVRLLKSLLLPTNPISDFTKWINPRSLIFLQNRDKGVN